MASRTDLVSRIGEAGAIPADRPIDHVRRISTALMTGGIVGSLVGLMIFIRRLTLAKMFIGIIPTLIFIALVVVAWKVLREKRTGDPVPVVARTLATNEPTAVRYVESGANPGLLVPVVAMPTDGSDTFRSVILIRQDGKDKVEEPPVGTLMALFQDQPGMGELKSADEITPEQEALMERLRKHPRILSNNAPALPLRRGALERTPGWAKLQWWLGVILGAIISFGFITLLV